MEQLDEGITFSTADIEGLDFTSDGETPISSTGALLPGLQQDGIYNSATQTSNEQLFSSTSLELQEYALSQNISIDGLEAQLGLNKAAETSLSQTFTQSDNTLGADLETIHQNAQKSPEHNIESNGGNLNTMKTNVTNSDMLDSDNFDVDTLFLNQQDLNNTSMNGSQTISSLQKANVIAIPVRSVDNMVEHSSADQVQPSRAPGKILTDHSLVNTETDSLTAPVPVSNYNRNRPQSTTLPLSSDCILGVSSIFSPALTTTTSTTMTDLLAAQGSTPLSEVSQQLQQQATQIIRSVVVSKISENTTIVKVSFIPTSEITNDNVSILGQNVQLINQDVSQPYQVITVQNDNPTPLTQTYLTDAQIQSNSESTAHKGNAQPHVLDINQVINKNNMLIAQLQRRSTPEETSPSSDIQGHQEGENANVSQNKKANSSFPSEESCHDGIERTELNVVVDDSQFVIECGHKRWKCTKCEKTYTTKHNLITHILGHSGIKPHSCLVCGKLFKQMSHLSTHMLIHGNLRPHMCKVCSRSFTQASHMKRHMAIHMEKRPYMCDICSRGFAYPSELRAHAASHRQSKQTCEECGKQFDCKKSLKTHHRVEHRKLSDLTCEKCQKVYQYPSQLRDHMIKHSDIRPYMCTECGMEFMKEHHLKSHYFTHTGQKPWKCDVCQRAFNQKANLQRHMLIHNAKKTHQCPQCDRRFAQPQTLKAHMVIHSEKKPFQCKVCGKEFGRLHNLHGHMHMHKDSKPHICFCGASFTLRGNLTRHKKVKHGITEEEAAKILNSMSSRRQLNSDSENGNTCAPAADQLHHLDTSAAKSNDDDTWVEKEKTANLSPASDLLNLANVLVKKVDSEKDLGKGGPK